MACKQSTITGLLLYALLFFSAITPTLSHPDKQPNPTTASSPILTSTSTHPALRAGTNKPKKIEPPSPKFKTTPDRGRAPELDLNVLAKDNLSSYDDDNMVLSTTKFMPGMYQTRIPIGNGYFGTTLAAAGPFFEKDVNQTNRDGSVTEGWPLFNDRQTFATISGFFNIQATTPRTNFAELKDLGWESVISGIPYSLTFNLVAGDHVLNSTVDPKTISNFVQTWRLQDGLNQWNYVWSPEDTKVSFDIEYVAFMSREEANVGATQLRVTPRGGDYNASIIDLLDGRTAQRSHLLKKDMLSEISQIYVGIHPGGLPNITAYVVSTANVSNGYTVESSRRMIPSMGYEDENNMTIGQEWDVQLIDGKTAVFEKFIGVASSDKFKSPLSIAQFFSRTSAKSGWDATVSATTKAWNALMKHNLIADYRNPSTGRFPESNALVEKLQTAAVVDRYISLINLLPENGMRLNDVGVSPTGLASDSYGGMIFWDQDLWVFPAAAVTSPEYAIQIPRSRVKLWKQAKANAQMPYVRNDYPQRSFGSDAVLYAWMHGRYGNATATGPAKDYQYHLNTDIALSMLQTRRITGNETMFKEEFWPVIMSVGHTITTLLEKDGDGWSIFNVTDPDEYAASVDNGAYVLSSMSAILHQIIALQGKYGETVNQTWIDMANNVNIPRRSSSRITQEYERMPNNIMVKQADVALISYPWHNTQNYSLQQKRKDLDYYTQKQNPDGPAMTYAINAIVENQIGEAGCSASTFHHKATVPYLRAPWFLMSEVPNDDVNGNGGVPPAFPFVTGHGGAAQIPLFGYLGLDLTQDKLTIQPSLPPPIPHLQTPDFYFQGARFRAAMNSTHTNITRLISDNTTVIHDVFASRSMPVVIGSPEGRRQQEFHSIAINQTLTIGNDMYWQTQSTKGNLVQCQPASSKSENVLGSWPGAATDGNPSTKWQSWTTDFTNLTIDMTAVPFQPVKQINFDWGDRPPKKARVVFTNSTDINSFKDERIRHLYVVELGNIIPSEPYRIFNETEPVQNKGNTTEFLVKNMRLFVSRGNYRYVPVYTGKYAILGIEGCNGCGSMNSWTGGNETTFAPRENSFGATVAEIEIIGASGGRIV